MRLTSAQVRAVVAQYYNLDHSDMQSAVRQFRIAHPRFMAWLLTRKHCPHMSLPQIGRAYGDRDHTTILHGLAAMQNKIATDDRWRGDWDVLDGVLSALAQGIEVPRIYGADKIARAREIHIQIAQLAGELALLTEEIKEAGRINFMAAELERKAA